MMQNYFAEELQKDFERKLGRLLTADEKELIQWMADSQKEKDRAEVEKCFMLKAES
ncbi:hypothetical protein [Salibacterium aidingense]|uniref:hypothetical protein n=1 Tax=Salibacterium aidingense TaxID=384933 RepID=UPI0003F7FE1E|nr:hypothetical protein [Salibacterium aidingense]